MRPCLNRLGWWFLCGTRACFHSVKCFKMKQAVWNQHEHLLPADWLLLSGDCFESLSLYFYALWKQKAIGMMWIVKNDPDFFFFLSPRQSVFKVSTKLFAKKQHLYPLNNASNAVLCSLKRLPSVLQHSHYLPSISYVSHIYFSLPSCTVLAFLASLISSLLAMTTEWLISHD